MKQLLAIILLSFIVCASNAQSNYSAKTITFYKSDGTYNSDPVQLLRTDKVVDRCKLTLSMGDENTSDFEIGYRYYLNGTWTTNFSLTGSGIGYFRTRLGIGKSPTYPLDVNGIIRASEIRVEAQTADFVFEDDYNLRKLSEVEAFIENNKHLPDIKSASKMKAEGVGLAEMNKLLLQKVEELTLYLIAQEKRINQLEETLNHESK